jgi:RHS repeat-associated protein
VVISGGGPGEKGFVGGAADTATGLTDLGAREYQPGTGSFISPDPLLKPYVPQNLNAYAYAADNPSTYSDPSGASIGQITGGPTGCVGTVASDKACDTKAQQEENQAKGAVAPSIQPGTGTRMICDPDGTCASAPAHREHPTHADPKLGAVQRTPPGHSVNGGKDKHGCPVAIDGVQIQFALGSCPGEGVTIGINFNSGDDEGQSGGDEKPGEITPGELTRGLENETDDPAENPDLSALTKVSDKQLKKWVGDPHEFKEENADGPVSHYDVYRDKKSGYLFLIPKGGGKPIPTYTKVGG